MALLNLSQAKSAVGTSQEIKYIYNGPASWPIPVSADKVGNNKVVYSEKIGAVSAAAKQAAGAPAAQAPSGNESYDIPMFMPTNKEGPQMEDGNIMGPKDPVTNEPRPMHMFNIDTRGHFLGKRLGFGFDGVNMADSWTGVYNSYFWTWICFVLMIVTYFVNPMISAVFAYLWGKNYGEHLSGFGTEITWEKGRSVIVAQ
jgi:hypothetical protein